MTLRDRPAGELRAAADACDALAAALLPAAVEAARARAWRGAALRALPAERRLAAAVASAHLAAVDSFVASLRRGDGARAAEARASAVIRAGVGAALVRHLPAAMAAGWNTSRATVLAAVAGSRRAAPAVFSLEELREQYPAFSIEWPEVGEFVRARAAAYAPAIARTTVGGLRRILAGGAERGLSIADIARELLAVAPSLSRARAAVIARTEIVAASNAAAVEAYHAAPEGVVRRKQWLHTRDERTRDTHRYSGVARLDEPFELPSGALLMYPGDTSLGAPLDEVVNCRCTVIPVVAGFASYAVPAARGVGRESDGD